MATVRRRRRGFRETLTDDQEMVLLVGAGAPGGEEAFENGAAEAAAWWANREYLLQASAAGVRPAGYWKYEAPEPKLPHEKDTVALLRLNLPLTLREETELEQERPPELPDAGCEQWFLRATAEACRIRQFWHERKNRPQQARAWEAKAEELEKLLRIKET